MSKHYTKKDMLSFGEYLMRISNNIIKKNTDLEPLDSKTGPKLVKDMFKKWKKL